MAGVPWGGSEVLWHKAANLLMDREWEATVNYRWWRQTPNQLMSLKDRGATLWFREEPFPPTLARRVLSKFLPMPQTLKTGDRVEKWLDTEKPDCVLVTVGYHPDRIVPANACIKRNIPYAINVQCASSTVFINENVVDEFRRMYTNAKKVFFVSKENQDKVEANIAMKLDNAEIVDNPYSVSRDANPDWPDYGHQFHLACVGRIHFQSKGQDLLVEVLSREKWKNRAIRIWFYGKSQGNRRQLKEMIRNAGLQAKLKFGGYSDDIEDLWANYHGLILPSRYEGAALVVVEAMMCNRICISTDMGRNAELMDEGETGFLAAAPTADLLDEALERAWRKRHEWREMGLLAGERIRTRYGLDPIEDYANRLEALTSSDPVPPATSTSSETSTNGQEQPAVTETDSKETAPTNGAVH